MPIKLLTSNAPFPHPEMALTRPNGLLAAGGDLSVERLLEAYRQGIFPWFMDQEPILWWSPDPRAVLFLNELHIPRSLKKILRRESYRVTMDLAFNQVIQACAAPRNKQPDTWITPEMQTAYCKLHEAGRAHSVEVFTNDKLIGGIYGVDCGHIFAGESMFSTESNASKIAFIYLALFLRQAGYLLIDCQIINPFLQQFGVREIARSEFLLALKEKQPTSSSTIWQKQTLPRVTI